jgi:N6-L-threonylcarbamoyladenine synthase
MRIYAIETSCDETGIAIIEASGGLKNPKFKIIKNFVASQIKIHRPFGGVVPNLAKREHLKNLPILFKKIEPLFKKQKSESILTVTVGPGLEPALWTGVNFAKEIFNASKKNNKKIKFIGSNHLEGHLYSFLLPGEKKEKINFSKIFPSVALIVSGGHTILLKMDSFDKWKKLGETRDDAVGEAFDKVARLLDLQYPGGPEIEKLAKKGNPNSIPFPRPMIHDKNYDFSFSGLKTAVLYYIRDNKNFSKENVSASFQQSATDVLVSKTIRAAKEFGAKSILLSGGVASNKFIRKQLKKEAEKNGYSFFAPKTKYNQDNAAMIAVAGYMAYCRNKKYKIEAKGDLDI